MKWENFKENQTPKNYYDILGIYRDATLEEIKSAYRKLAKESHPDAVGDDSKREDFHKINEAYETLIDENKRATYDWSTFINERRKESSSAKKESDEFKDEFMENNIHELLEYLTFLVEKKPEKAKELRINLVNSLHFVKDGKKIEKYNILIKFLDDKLGKRQDAKKDLLHGEYYNSLNEQDKKIYDEMIKYKSFKTFLEILALQSPQEFEKTIKDYFKTKSRIQKDLQESEQRLKEINKMQTELRQKQEEL